MFEKEKGIDEKGKRKKEKAASKRKETRSREIEGIHFVVGSSLSST